MKSKILTFAIILFFSIDVVFGQDWNLINYSYIQNSFQLPASPGAASFTRYDNFNVSHYTGAANVGIGLCEIGDEALNMPISLNYTASGVKVDDLPGWVGLGWNISAGGAITRTVLGHPDMPFNYYNANSNWPNESGENADKIAERKFLHDVAEGSIETQADMYNFHFGPYSGGFIIKKDYTIMSSDKSNNLSIVSSANGFTITDAAGYKYIFGVPETTSYVFETISGSGPTWQFDFQSAWYLIEVQHPNVAEGKLTLEYTTISGFQDKLLGWEAVTTWNYNHGGACCGGAGGGFSTGSITQQSINSRKIINKINFFKNSIKWQEVVFTNSANTSPQNFGSFKIDKIQKFDLTDNISPHKTIDLTYTSSTGRLTLERITETGRNSLAMPPYIFEYESGTLPDPFGVGVDFWGYSNGSTGGLIHPLCSIAGSGNTTRLASFASGKTGTLNKVIYPTGGYTKYIYEKHTVAPFTITTQCSQTYTEVGGVRVKQIEHYTKDNILTAKREYKYLKDNGVESSGLMLNFMEFANPGAYNHENTGACEQGSCDPGDYSCQKTTLTPNAIQFDNYFTGGPVGYSRVEEVIVSNNSAATSGKSVYEFHNFLYSNSDYIENGELKTSASYDATGNILEKSILSYFLDNNPPNVDTYRRLWVEPETQSNYVRLCKQGAVYVWCLPFNCIVTPCYNNTCDESFTFETRLKRRLRTVKQKINYLLSKQVIKYVYESGVQKAITQTINYEYNYASAVVPTKMSTTNSDNKTHELRYTYPVPGSSLFNKNMLAIPTEVEKYVGTNKIYGYKTTFATFNGNLKPSKVEEAFGTGAYTDSEEILAYDANGKVLEAKKTNDQENAYLWWSSPTYLTAYAQNAKQSEVLYASFERPVADDGGWTTNTNFFQYADKAGAAGNGYYLGATSLTQGKNVPLGKYILSYYTSNTAGTIIAAKSGTTMAVLTTKTSSVAFANGMFLVEKVIDFTAGTGGLAGLTISFASNVKIDEVRLYPQDALMQTFSYDKKSGLLLSICDPSGMPARFEYDGLNRLTGVLNMDNHYLQTHEYFYNTASFNYNALIKRNVLLSGQTSLGMVQALTGADVIREFGYFDGLGRPVQQVLLDQAPNSDDIVKYSKYDNFNREPYGMLPYNTNGANTAWNTVFRTAATTEQSSFWGGQFAGENVYAFVEKILENSPLSRVLEIKPQGQTFSAHGQQFAYMTNGASEVRNFFIANQYYAEKTLFKTKITDENGRISYTYSDYLGRKIMEDSEGFKTYYLYNDAGQLIQVIQPEGSKLAASLINTSASVSRQSFVYTYDSDYRLSTKKLPGITGDYTFYYDRLDRKVMEKDPKGFKIFYKYDILSRVVLTGRYTGTGTPNGTEQLYENKNTTSPFYTNNLSFPTSLCANYTVAYFDDYNFNNDAAYVDDVSYQANPSAGMTSPSNFTTNHPSNLLYSLVRGKPTGSRAGILKSDQSAPTTFVEQYTFYDKYSRPLQSKTVHPYGGAEIEWMKYNFAGWVMVHSKEHQATLNGVPKKLFLTDRYTYDHTGRGLNTFHQIDNLAEVQLSSQSYNARSEMQQKVLGTSLQTVDYSYNIRGWLTAINNVAACNNDVFSLKLNYETPIAGFPGGATVAQWNGNVSASEWRTGVNCLVDGVNRNKALYGFTYDTHDRLTQAKYTEHNGSAYVNTDNYNEVPTYNDNGDILTLTRRGKNGVSSFGQIDNLTYNYTTTGAMRLSSISESGSWIYGYKPTAASSTWSYDNNGNVTARSNTGIAGAQYNHLNLPDLFTNTGGAEITNTYDAAGRKWFVNANGVATHYFGQIEYENNTLQAIYHADGRIIPVSGSYEYHYYLKDHLGNTRAVVKGTQAAPVLMQEFHYYPFGMQMEGAWATPTGLDQKYKYNGKELVDDLGLNWYDYGARWYDPSVARWMQVDPMAESYAGMSPYNYGMNNPVNVIDPSGMAAEWIGATARKSVSTIRRTSDLEARDRSLHDAGNAKTSDKPDQGQDYVLAINHNEQTITVKATYYVQNGDANTLASAEKATQFWNSQSGKYSYNVKGKEGAISYVVNFELNVIEVDNPAESAENDRRSFEIDGSPKITPDQSSNAYSLNPDEHKIFESSDEGVSRSGTTRGGMDVHVKESISSSDTGAHEIGHTLGLKHYASGIMTSAGNSPYRDNSITRRYITRIIRNAFAPTVAKGHIQQTGTSPQNFEKGKSKKS